MRSEARKSRAQVANTYLPKMLQMLVALKWQQFNINKSLGLVQYDNPYPSPPGDIEVPGNWYAELLWLAHHKTLLPDTCRVAAGALEGIESWNSIVDDYEAATSALSSLIASIEKLVALLEEQSAG